MQRALAGATVRAIESPLPQVSRAVAHRDLIGATIDRIEARGKYLLVRFSCGLTILTHMRMDGSWHLYRPGDLWRRPRSAMRVRIVTEWEAAGFGLPIVELHDAASLARTGRLARLGPDPLGGRFDPSAVAARLRESGLTIEEALLDQRAIAGVGQRVEVGDSVRRRRSRAASPRATPHDRRRPAQVCMSTAAPGAPAAVAARSCGSAAPAATRDERLVPRVPAGVTKGSYPFFRRRVPDACTR